MKHRIPISIIASTGLVIFALLSSMMGTYAWFMSSQAFDTTVSRFSVVSSDASIESVSLLKYVYPRLGIGDYDYTDTEHGSVQRFSFDPVRQKFGHMVDSVWESVDVMNLYDPLEYYVNGTSLLDLKCNVIFEVTFYSEQFSTASLKASAIREHIETLLDRQILLSSCADFDVFLPADLDDNSEVYYDAVAEKYKVTDGEGGFDDYDPLGRAPAAGDERDFFKFSILSSLLDSHANYYEAGGNQVNLPINEDPVTLVFTANRAKAYINVNYSPEVLLAYRDQIAAPPWIRAVYDYSFSFLIS